MTKPFKVACVQTNTGPEVATNIEIVTGMIRQARTAGAELILLPEVVNAIDLSPAVLAPKTTIEKDDVSLAAYRTLAKELGCWILIGSLVLKHETAHGPSDHRKLANRSILIDDQGGIVARYDKIHMFDVDLDGGESYRESNAYEPGEKATLANTPWGKLGMTICYDLRFPYLHRELAQAGASFISVPAAFTRPTGQAHWHVLLRARAIETGCYIFAPAQCGEHEGGRLTYGHSLIINPWGEILAEGGEDVGYVMAEIDPARVEAARGKVPSLKHTREYTLA